MAITIDIDSTDAQGFPVVSWIEDRTIFGPNGAKRERVSCFIKPDKATGELLFVSIGSVRHGATVEARPWAKLASFELCPAEELYLSTQDKALRQALGQKNAAARVLMTDSSSVVVAHCGGRGGLDRPMHLNCADAPPAQAHELHAVLARAFLETRERVVPTILKGESTWPTGKAFVEFKPPELEPPPWWHEWAANAIVVAVLGLLALFFYWLLVS